MAREKNAFKNASDLIVAANRRPGRESSMRSVFLVARRQGALVRYAVNVRVVRLTRAGLSGEMVGAAATECVGVRKKRAGDV